MIGCLWKSSMRRFRLALVLLLAVNPPHLLPQESRPQPASLWTWFGNCADKSYMRLEVLLRGKVIHRSSFPVCPITDLSQEVGGQQKTVAFSFKGGHVFQGEYHTAMTQTIEGNIWQAGTDPGAILFGVSFSSQNQILLNTIHVAKPRSQSTSEIDRGLIVSTSPIGRE
jgi:hypothetical protein